MDADSEIGNLLHRIGVSSKYNGFNYIHDALVIMHDDESYRDSTIKRLYKRIASDYNCSISGVERNIRTCIEKTWYRISYDELMEVFGSTLNYEDDRPTNREFIYNLFDFFKFNKRSKQNPKH